MPTPQEMRLTKADYVAILNYYNIPTAGLTQPALKAQAEEMLAEKMCRCIKKLDRARRKKQQQQRRVTRSTRQIKPVAICRDSVFHKKRLKVYSFQCQPPQGLHAPKNSRRTLKVYKTARTLGI